MNEIWDIYIPNQDNMVTGNFYSQEEAIIYILKNHKDKCDGNSKFPYALKRLPKKSITNKIIFEFKNLISYIKYVTKRLLEK